MRTDSVSDSARQDRPSVTILAVESDHLGCTVQPKSIDHCIQIGQEAWSRLTACQSWNDWLLVGEALLVGRAEAMRAAHTNKPEGRRYNEEFSYWLKANKFGSVDKSTRSRLLECLARRDEIESWRVTLATSDRLKLNHPTAVLRRWQKTLVRKPSDTAPKVSHVSFTPHDKPRDQAAIIWRLLHCSPSAARALSGELSKLARAAETDGART